ncbi:hypothetical protein NMYAN_330009 [Nitrosomonas nitrosa]|uniref:Uncharacterized protein n=1 Tax=Nitrosomonas nitrosa TaxID=52442 RepID=A0A8H8Z0L2_9PROT|nr:hypothetical protein NMYAN_330009 [Nitrosomonas nitrosa]
MLDCRVKAWFSLMIVNSNLYGYAASVLFLLLPPLRMKKKPTPAISRTAPMI